jgi:PAS domain S-box-containing protein
VKQISDEYNVSECPTVLARHAGEMADRMGRVDWSTNPLGPPCNWPDPLITLIDLMLASRQPMFIAWGEAQTWLYNDAFIPILGEKHPQALGRPAMEVWAEAREVLEPLFGQVFAGKPIQMDDFSLLLNRHGRLEEAHFSFSYTPVHGSDGDVGGLFGACIETTSKILAERQSLHEREQLARLFEQAPTFMALLVGPEHRFALANPNYMKLVGHRGVLGLRLADALPDAVEQGYLKLLDQVLATGEPYRAESALYAAQKEPGGAVEHRYVDFVYQPVFGPDGSADSIFVLGADVTERAIAEATVARNAKLQGALDKLHIQFNELDDPADIAYAAAQLLGETLNVSRAGYGTIDPTTETIFIERDWNAPGVKTLAGTLHFRDYGSYIENLKRGETAVVADADLDPRTCDTAEALKAISAQAFVNMPVTEQDGLVALLYLNHATSRPWPEEELKFIRDVAERTRMATERRRVETQLVALTASLERQVEERTAERDRVWQNSRDLLAIIGADGVFRRVNPAWLRILGFAATEVEGRAFLDFVWPDDRQVTQAALEAAATADDLNGFVNRYRHKDGTPRWISWQTATEGDLVYAYGRDVTEEKMQAEALAQAHDALRQSQKLEAMGQLTGGVAHDFNNLLTPIMGSLDMLQKRGVGGPREQRLIDGALQSAERAKTLVQRLLAFSRRQPLQSEPVDVAELVRGMSELIGSTTGPQIQMATDVADDLPRAVADANQLEMAILNLAVNARDAMPDGGTLRIVANARTAARGNKLGLSPGSYVCISVADTGIGMDASALKRAVEPFFSTKGLGKGTGLGLSMVHGLAAQLGGAVHLASQVGLGTNVELWLPSTDERTERAAGELTPVEAGPASGTILLVDDEEVARETTADMLREMGFVVTQSASGEEALAQLRSGLAPDLLISDHLMPGMSGEELAREVRTAHPKIKLLIISGFADLEGISPDIPRLNKPFRQHELAAMIAELSIEGPPTYSQ